MSLMLASFLVAAPPGYVTMPVFQAAACRRTKSPGSCRKCVSFKKAYFPNGTCRPMVRANEGGLANPMQCKAQRGVRRNQCNRCLSRRFPHRFFPNASGELRCRYLRGAGLRKPAQKIKAKAPIQARTMCHRVAPANRNACRSCTQRAGNVFFDRQNGARCFASVKANEGGLRHRNQCSKRGMNARIKAKCSTCLKHPNMRFFPHAGMGMRCRWLKGSSSAKTVKRAPIRPNDLITEQKMCRSLPKVWDGKCERCFNRRKGQKVGFVRKGSTAHACRVLVARNAGGIKVPKLCQTIANPVARQECLRCVNNPFWQDAYFTGAGPKLRCRHVVSPARLNGKRAQPMMKQPVKNNLPGMMSKPKVSNADVQAAFANQGKPGLGLKKMKPGITVESACLKRFMHKRSMRQACRRCLKRLKPHRFVPGSAKGKRCMRR